MSKDVLVQRLEAVVSRLEKFADGVATKGTGGASAAAGGAASPALQGFDAFFSKSVTPFISAAKAFKETTKVGELTEKVFKCLHDLVAATAKCKKPSQMELSAFVDPISKVMQEAEKIPDKRQTAWFPFHKSFAEAVVAFTWVMAPAPKLAIEMGIEPADVYLNKILMEAKKLTGETQAQHRAYVSTMKGMLNGMLAYATEYFKMGLEWNAKGGALSSFSAGDSGADTAGAPEAPPAPADLPEAPPAPADIPSGTPAAGSGEGGLAAVFGQLNTLGEAGVTKGLKKVTKEMKTKNLKDVPVLKPKEKNEQKAAPEQKEKKKKPPKLELAQGTWFCENYEDQAELVIPDVQMKENVYISKCKKCLIRVPDKAKSIQVDSCQKVTVLFKSVVSTFEIVNSQSITADCAEQCPSFALDKSNGVQVVLSKAVVEQSPAPPDIVSSCITASNVVVPGKTDKDDPIEIPLPEQYVTKYDPKTFKLSTETIKHSGG